MLLRELLGAAALVALATAPSAGQGAPAPAAQPAARTVSQAGPRIFRGRLVGVFDLATGDPIEGVEVRDMLSGLSALTTSAGTLTLFFVDTAGSFIRIRKMGYEAQTILVSNRLTDSIPLTLVLTPSGQQLPAVLTTDSSRRYRTSMLRGFEERSHLGRGYFVNETALQKEVNRRIPDVIRAHIPGVNFVKGAGTSWYLVTNRGESTKMDGSPCYPDVFIDGVSLTKTDDLSRRVRTRAGKDTVRAGGITGVDISQFTVSDFAGIEYYNSSTIPPQFTLSAQSCGALLLWSRER